MVFAQTASQVIDFHFFHLSLRHAGFRPSRERLRSTQHLGASGCGGRDRSACRLAAETRGVLAAALVGVLTVPRALEGRVSAFKHYDVPIVVVPLAIVFVVAFALTFRDVPRARSIVWTSLALLACSFALHAIGPQADGVSRPNLADYTWAYQLTGMFKHGAELAGWILLATGMIAGASRRMGDDLPTVRDVARLLRRKRAMTAGR